MKTKEEYMTMTLDQRVEDYKKQMEEIFINGYNYNTDVEKFITVMGEVARDFALEQEEITKREMGDFEIQTNLEQRIENYKNSIRYLIKDRTFTLDRDKFIYMVCEVGRNFAKEQKKIVEREILEKKEASVLKKRLGMEV